VDFGNESRDGLLAAAFEILKLSPFGLDCSVIIITIGLVGIIFWLLQNILPML